MTYRVNRAIGYQDSGRTNPWVYADYGQPQRRRGYVSPIIFKTQPPGLRSIHLGEESDRAARMERYTLIGLGISAISLALFAYHIYARRPVRANKRRKPRPMWRTDRVGYQGKHKHRYVSLGGVFDPRSICETCGKIKTRRGR